MREHKPSASNLIPLLCPLDNVQDKITLILNFLQRSFDVEHLRGGLASSLSRYLTKGAKFHLGIVEEEENEKHINCDDCEM